MSFDESNVRVKSNDDKSNHFEVNDHKRRELRSPQRKMLSHNLLPTSFQSHTKSSKKLVFKESAVLPVLSPKKFIQNKECEKCFKFFGELETSNVDSTSGSDSEHALKPCFHRSNKMGLSPIPLIHDNNFNAIIESMKIQRQFLHGSFIIKDRNECDQDKIIQTFEFGFIKQRKRYAINKKLNQIKESTNRSEAIKSVLEYTKAACRDQIVDDLKRLEDEIKTHQAHITHSNEHNDEIKQKAQPKSSKIINTSKIHHIVPCRRKSFHIDKSEIKHKMI